MQKVAQIYETVTKIKDKLNIVWLPYNGYLEYTLEDTPHQYWAAKGLSVYKWHDNVGVPKNFKILEDLSKIPYYVDVDLVVCNSRYEQMKTAKYLSSHWQVPWVSFEHNTSHNEATDEYKGFIDSHVTTKHQFVPNHIINDTWNLELPVIGYNLGESKLYEKTENVLIIGDYSPQDLDWVSAIAGLVYDKGINVYGNNIGFSNPLDREKTLAAFKLHKVFINLSDTEKVPTLALMAAQHGCAIVHNNTEWNRWFGGEYVAENTDDFKRITEELLDDEKKLSDNVHWHRSRYAELTNNDMISYIADCANKVYTR